MKAICQLYVPSFFRSFGENSLKEVIRLLPDLKKANFSGIYLIALWEDGDYDNGFDIIRYSVNYDFGTDDELTLLIKKAHELGLTVGVDVVPHHVSNQNVLALNHLSGVPSYKDCLYEVSREEAERLTSAGVPSFFGKHAYSNLGGRYIRSSFTDYHQLDLNWNNKKVQEYFAKVFSKLKALGIDFVRVDCGMMLLEDVSKANPNDPMACMNPKASIEAIRQVSGGMPMFFEWFDPSTAYLFDGLPECYALDCSYVITGRQNLHWDSEKLIPLLGGHDQKTAADRHIDIQAALNKMSKSKYGFLDIQTLIGWQTDPRILPDDIEYDADIKNPNQRYRARRPIAPIITEFRRLLVAH